MVPSSFLGPRISFLFSWTQPGVQILSVPCAACYCGHPTTIRSVSSSLNSACGLRCFCYFYFILVFCQFIFQACLCLSITIRHYHFLMYSIPFLLQLILPSSGNVSCCTPSFSYLYSASRVRCLLCASTTLWLPSVTKLTTPYYFWVYMNVFPQQNP